MTIEIQSELDHETGRAAAASQSQTVDDFRRRLQEAIDKSFNILLEQEHYVPSRGTEARQVWAGAIPAFERNQITGYEVEMGDINFRVIRRSTRLRCRIGGWLIEKVGDPARGMLVDKFPEVLRVMSTIAFVTGLHCGRSSPVRVTLNVWQRRPA